MGIWSALGSGLLGLTSGISGYYSQKATNAANLQATRETNDMNYKIAQEINQANKDMYQQQFQDQLQMWHMQNAYNDPSQEVARLRAAGLNPSLAFGDAAQAGSMSVPSASPAVGATMQAPQYSDVLGTAVQTAINNAVSAFTGYGSGSKDLAEAKGVEIDNQTRAAMNQAELDKAMADIRHIVSSERLNDAQKEYYGQLYNKLGEETRFLRDSHDLSIENLRLQGAQTSAAAKALDAQAQSFAAEKAYKDSLTRLNQEQLKVEPQRLKAVIDNLVADTANKYAQAYQAREVGKTQASVRNLNQANANLANENRHESIARQYKLKLESAGVQNYNEVFEKTKDYVIKEAEYAADQAAQTYYNPFHYVGNLLGGSGAAAIKMMK